MGRRLLPLRIPRRLRTPLPHHLLLHLRRLHRLDILRPLPAPRLLQPRQLDWPKWRHFVTFLPEGEKGVRSEWHCRLFLWGFSHAAVISSCFAM